MLDCLQQYTFNWKIKVALEITKIGVYRKDGRLEKNEHCWNYDNEVIY